MQAFHRHFTGIIQKKGFWELRSTCNKLIEEMSRRLLTAAEKKFERFEEHSLLTG